MLHAGSVAAPVCNQVYQEQIVNASSSESQVRQRIVDSMRFSSRQSDEHLEKGAEGSHFQGGRVESLRFFLCCTVDRIIHSMCTSHAFWSSSQLAKSHAHIGLHMHMNRERTIGILNGRWRLVSRLRRIRSPPRYV